MRETSLLPPPGHHARLLALFLLAAAPFAFGALALALGQDANWDLRNYHWYNAYAYLNDRFGFDLIPAQTPSFYNPLIDVPFYVLAIHVPARVTGFVLGFVQGLNFIPLFMLAYATLNMKNHWVKTTLCAALAALCLLGGGGIALIGTTFYDNVTSIGLFASALLVIRYREKLMTKAWQHAFGYAFLFGLPSGLMMGLKLPSVIFCMGFCFGIFAMGGSFRRLFLISFAFGLGVLAGVVISLGPWAIFLQTHFHNPLFPYFNDIFKSPYAPLTSARDVQFIPHGWHDILLYPFIFADNPYRVGEIEWRDWCIPILYGLLPVTVILNFLFRREEKKRLADARATRYLLAAGTIAYVIWIWMFAIYRYAVPIEMLTPLLIVLAVDLLPLKLPVRAVIAVCLLVIVAASVEGGNWTRRSAWLDRFVEVQVPELPAHKGLMILMAGFEPYSHVVPEFPSDISFVRIQSNFVSPGENKGFNQLIRERVEGHKGTFMLLIPDWQIKAADEPLAYYHLARANEPCQTVLDRLYDDKPLSLCRVVRR